MHNRNNDVELPTPVELRRIDFGNVAGGSPPLPLPPPARFSPDPVPWELVPIR